MSVTNRKALALQRLLLALPLPLALYGFSSGPPINRTGAPVDGGQNCSACHRTFGPANSGPGRISISAVSYTPGAKQTITITVEDPTAQRWGFQLTARYRSDETVAAGTFHPADGIRVRCDPDGRDAPCFGAKEFVEHTQPVTQLGTTGHGTFTVDWIAPEKDFGEVVFYAAGNAANGDGTNLNDHIYTTSKVIRADCNVSGTPTVYFVGDAASLRPAIVPGGMISIYGDGFMNTGNTYRAVASDLVDGKLPVDFGCIQVSIGGQSAPIMSATGGLINVQVPPLDAGTATEVRVTVRSGDRTAQSDAMRVQVAGLAPALFTTDGSHVAATRNNTAVSGDAPAKPGDTVSLFGTGFGATNPAWGLGEFPKGQSPLVNPVSVTLANVTLADGDILYAGAAPDQPGVCQIDVRVPDSLADGDVAVTVRVAGQASQDGTVLTVKR